MRTLATLLLLASLVACSRDGSSERPAPSPTASSTAPSPSTPTPAEKPSLENLPEGPPPRIAYADEDVVVHPDGRRERLVGQRRIGVTSFAPFRDGYLVADERIFEGTVGLAYVRGRRRTDLGPCASGGAVLSRDGRHAAWMTQGCPESTLLAPTVVHIASTRDDTEEQREIERIGIVGVSGFVDGAVVVSGYVGGVQLVGPEGRVGTVPRLRYARSVAEGRGLVAGLLPSGDSHGAVVDARSGELLWKRRHTYPGVFSPNGMLLAGDVRRRPALMDATTGRVVALLRISAGSVYDWVWEDRRHLLAVAYHRGTQAMVRIDLRGQVTRVGPVVPDDGIRYVFETRP